jgi:hypothetical protein
LIELLLGGGGLIGVIKLLRGSSSKKAAVVDIDPAHVSVRAGDGTTLTIRREVLQLYENPAIREDVARIVAPVLRPDIDALEVRSLDGDTLQMVTRQEAPWFEPPEEMLQPVEPPLDQPKIEESVVRVRKLWLTKHGRHKWTLQDGRGDFNAFIEDYDFLAKVDEGVIKIGSRDAMRVRLRLDPGGVPNSPAIYTVEKVIEYLPAPYQRRMLADSDDE